MLNNKITDLELVEKYKIWDISVSSKIFDKYFDEIYKYIFVRVWKKEIAENLITETFSQLLSILEKIDNDWSEFIKNDIFEISDILIEQYFKSLDTSVVIDNQDFSKILKNKLEVVTYTKIKNTKNKKINIAKKTFFTFKKDWKNIFEWPKLNYFKILYILFFLILIGISSIFYNSLYSLFLNIYLWAQ